MEHAVEARATSDQPDANQEAAQLTPNPDIAIIGGGAAGLMTAIWAGRTDRSRRIIVLDSARKLGAKVLVSGGGRCNVTHDEVDERAYAGSSPNAIRKVLRRFTVPQTIEFFRELGVELKREETGKLFPVTDSARTVLEALLRGAADVGVELMHPARVESVRKQDGRFIVAGEWGSLPADRVVLATGGRSLPKTGSDGHGYDIARSLGHSITPRITPALVPLTLPREHFICSLSGLTIPATLEVRSSTGKRLISFTNSTLCTHFGLSGPSVLDISRYWIDASMDDSGARLVINWLPGETVESVDRALVEGGGRHADEVDAPAPAGAIGTGAGRACRRGRLSANLPTSARAAAGTGGGHRRNVPAGLGQPRVRLRGGDGGRRAAQRDST